MAERRVFRYPKAPKLETEFVEENFEEEIGPIDPDSNNFQVFGNKNIRISL